MAPSIPVVQGGLGETSTGLETPNTTSGLPPHKFTPVGSVDSDRKTSVEDELDTSPPYIQDRANRNLRNFEARRVASLQDRAVPYTLMTAGDFRSRKNRVPVEKRLGEYEELQASNKHLQDKLRAETKRRMMSEAKLNAKRREHKEKMAKAKNACAKAVEALGAAMVDLDSDKEKMEDSPQDGQ